MMFDVWRNCNSRISIQSAMPNARTAAGPQVLVPSLHRQWRANEVHFGNGLSLAGRPIAARAAPRRPTTAVTDRRPAGVAVEQEGNGAVAVTGRTGRKRTNWDSAPQIANRVEIDANFLWNNRSRLFTGPCRRCCVASIACRSHLHSCGRPYTLYKTDQLNIRRQ